MIIMFKTAAYLQKFIRKRKKFIKTYYLVLIPFLLLNQINYVCILMYISVCLCVYPYTHTFINIYKEREH